VVLFPLLTDVRTASIVGGKLSDRFGRLPAMLLMTVLQLVACVLCVLASPAQPWLYYLATASMGASGGLLNTQLYSTVGFMFPGQLNAVFAGTFRARFLCVGVI
jgi:MFS family permease